MPAPEPQNEDDDDNDDDEDNDSHPVPPHYTIPYLEDKEEYLIMARRHINNLLHFVIILINSYIVLFLLINLCIN